MQGSFLSSIEAVKKWFELNNLPYFTLYRGFKAGNDNVIYRNSELDNPEQSWAILEDLLNAHIEGGGVFRLFVCTEPKRNVGQSVNIKLTPLNPNLAGSSVGSTSTQFGIYGSPGAMIEAEIERRMELFELKQENEALKAGNEAGLGVVDRVVNNLVERPELYQLIQALTIKIMGGMSAPAQAVPVPVNGPGEGADLDGFNYEVLEPALDKIRTVFPDVENTLVKLADWITANPEMAKGFFQQLN